MRFPGFAFATREQPRGARGTEACHRGEHDAAAATDSGRKKTCKMSQKYLKSIDMKRKRFRFLMHKPDYPPEVAAEIQACVAPHSPRTSPHPLTPAPLRQSRIRECAAVVKGKSLPLFSSVFDFFLLYCPPTVFEDISSPRHKRKRAAPSESETTADRPSAASLFDDHAATSAQLPAQPPPAAETAPPPPASESRAAKSSPFRPLLRLLLRYHSPPPPYSQAGIARSTL